MVTRRSLAMLAAMLLAPAARAGILDWFTGASVGAVLPAHDAQLVAGQVPDNAKLTLIDFWATWCAPCRNNVPRLNEMAQRFAPRGMTLIAVSKESPELVARHLPAWGMKYAVFAGGKQPLQTSLSIRALPYSVLVNKANRIVWRGQPEELTDTLVESFLANAAS